MRFFKFKVAPAGTSSPERTISVQFFVELEFLRSAYPVEPLKIHGRVKLKIGSGVGVKASERQREESNVERIEPLIVN